MMKSKKVISTILISFLLSLALLLSPKAGLAADASLSLSPASGGPYTVGNNFSLSVWAKTGENKVDTIRASLTFPASLLTVQSVALGSTYSAPSGGNAYDNTAGTIYWGGGAYGGTTTDAVFATITFKAKAAGTATVSFASNSLVLSAGQAVPFASAGGSYTISSATTTPKPTPTPTPKPNTTTGKTITNTAEVTTTADGSVTLSGKASIGSAIIKINIEGGLLSDSVTAGGTGNWNWSLPKGFAPGTYSAAITAVHPEDSSVTSIITKNFEVKITEAVEKTPVEAQFNIVEWLATPLAWVIIIIIIIIIVVIIALAVKRR